MISVKRGRVVNYKIEAESFEIELIVKQPALDNRSQPNLIFPS